MTETSLYQFFDATGCLLYVGITDRGLQRTREHSRSKEWWPEVRASTVEHFPDRPTALEREADLIQRFRPRFNVQHNRKRVAVPLQGVLHADGDLKDRIKAWYAMSKRDKKLTPCVACGERPWHRGPMCFNCYEKYSTDLGQQRG